MADTDAPQISRSWYGMGCIDNPFHEGADSTVSREPPVVRPRAGFNLVELLLVLSVIILLMGLSYPISRVIRNTANIKSARMLVQSVHTAVEQCSVRTVTGRDGHGYDAWTLGHDGSTAALDGNPAAYPPASVIQARAPAGYSGFVIMTRFSIDSARLDSLGRVIDPWRSPLQISWAVNTYGTSGFGVWSFGPDTIDGTSDDIKSWDRVSE